MIRLRPEDVFTPRSSEVNAEMYIQRQDLEDALIAALRGNLHIVIHGESGTGKSWLYKKVFTDLNVNCLVANLANASRLGSIAAELRNLADRDGQATKTGYEEEKRAGVDVVVASSELTHTGQYLLGQKEPFEAILQKLRKNAGHKPAVLVFDNLEAIFSSDNMLKELANLIMLCDDDRYSYYKVKILIVGVPQRIKEYFYRTPHLSTVANRINELPEVSRLTKPQCEQLIQRGFLDKLKYLVDDLDSISKHVVWVTERIPQRVHEYCLELAYLSENKLRLQKDHLSQVDKKWLSNSLSHASSVIESHMNERDTKVGRRNQALYALAYCENEQFKAPDLETLIRKYFPKSTESTTLNIPQILAQLASSDKPIVRRSPKGDSFQIIDPRYRMALRTMLILTADEQVENISNNKR